MKLRMLACTMLLLCGCVPNPHRVQVVPALSGNVTRDGKPVQGAEIRVSYGVGRVETLVVSTTDVTGAYSYGGKKETRSFSSYGDPVFDWSLTIHSAGQDYLGHTDSGLGYVPESAVLNCELSKPQGQPVCGSP